MSASTFAAIAIGVGPWSSPLACPDVSLTTHAWPGLRLVELVAEGRRNAVWRGGLDGRAVAVRRSRRSPSSLRWELDLLRFLAERGVRVPAVVPTEAGEWSAGGVVVQEWLDGRPPSSDADRLAVAATLRRLHELTAGYGPQRPGCCTVVELRRRRRSVDADVDALPRTVRGPVLRELDAAAAVPLAVVHGDPGPSNIRIDADGTVGLLDWDESRIDATWLDLAGVGVRVLEPSEHARALRLADAWETVNGWSIERGYAEQRFARLGP